MDNGGGLRVHLAGLVKAGLVNTLGIFFADIQDTPASIQFFFSWSADGVIYSTETQVTSGSSLGAFTTANSPGSSRANPDHEVTKTRSWWLLKGFSFLPDSFQRHRCGKRRRLLGYVAGDGGPR